jgi:aryl-alcohol dehydrogenase-like predicted oxidoreductase
LSFGAWVTFGNQVGRGAARDMIAAAWDHGVNFFDNAEGYANGESERVMGDVIADLRLPRARAFTALAAGLGVTPAALAIAWCLRNPHVSSVILGASRVVQLLQNLEALDVGARVDDAGWARVEAVMA